MKKSIKHSEKWKMHNNDMKLKRQIMLNLAQPNYPQQQILLLANRRSSVRFRHSK